MKYIRYSGMLLPLLFATVVCMAQGSEKPNIIFIVADDLGYGNLTSYNPKGKVPTPNIDRLATEGTRFTRFYAGSTVCAPSRCALMTGRHMGHAYIRGNTREPLRPQDTTLAQRLKANGYATGMFGKWGLGEENTSGAPEYKGWDAFFGYLNQTHAHRYYTDHLFELANNHTVRIPVDTGTYTDELILQKALGFIRDNQHTPFFLYLPLTIPHAELQVPPDYMKRFQQPDGSSKLTPETPFQPQPGGSYRAQAQPHAAFAGMITRLDEDVNRILALVKDLGLDGNTYIFFTSDNGPHKEGGADPAFFNSSGPLRGIKRDLYEGGIRVPLLVRAPGKVPAGKVRNDCWAFWDLLPTLCEITGTTAPAGIDGISFTPAVNGKKQIQQHTYLYWQFKETSLKEAVVQGDWKLVRLKDKGKPEVLELYNLKLDAGERHNLAASQPAKLKQLYALTRQAKAAPENPLFDWSDMEQP